MRKITYWLSLILIFMIPWEDSVNVAALGSLTRIAGIIVALFWIFSILLRGKIRTLNIYHALVYLFIIWNIATAFWSVGLEETQGRIITYLQLFVLILMLWDLYDTQQALYSGLQAYILGAWVSIISIIVNYFSGMEFRSYSGRYSATGLNPGDLVITLLLGLPIAWHLGVSISSGSKNLIMKYINFAYIPTAIFATLLTASRMALFAIIPALFYIIIEAGHIKFPYRIVIFTLIIVALFIIQPYIPQSAIERLISASSSISSGDLGGRVNIWKEGIELFLVNPLLGIGSGAFRTAVDVGGVAHNTFLSVLTETGSIGFIIFVSIIAVVSYQAIHQPTKYSRLWMAVLLVWTIGVSAQTWEHRKSTWLFLSLVVVSGSLYKRKLLYPKGFIDKRLIMVPQGKTSETE